jgi:hypothetical protein
MTDSRDDQEPITGNDPTNGLAGDLEGDDGGAVEQDQPRSVFEEVIADLDPDRTPQDEDSATPYSEEGQP